MGKKVYNNNLKQEIVVTPKGNYTIPTLQAYIEEQQRKSRNNAALHIMQQEKPDVPVIPSRSPWSIAAAVFGMSDEERIRRFGTADVQTCIFTATSQFNDAGAKVAGNKTFRRNPQKYGFKEVPSDSADIGDLVQFSEFGTPHHSVLVSSKNSKGEPLLSYSRGSDLPYDTDIKGDTISTMVKNNPIDKVEEKSGPYSVFRYIGSPEKRAEWKQEYFNKYGLNPRDFDAVVEKEQHTEQPDATRVQKPIIQTPVGHKAEGGFISRKRTAFDRLSMPAQAEMIRVAVNRGIHNLKDIRDAYNEYAEGGSMINNKEGYDEWKRRIEEYKGILIDEDNTYDYEGFYNKYPDAAWSMLNDNPEAHFTDEFKTVYHPTFSAASENNEGSIYSGVRHPIFNPDGIKGGTWSPDYSRFIMSDGLYRSPVSMDERKEYLENAEDNGVQLIESDGSLPVYDGIPWGGVLPSVTVQGNKRSYGGSIHGPLVEAALNEYDVNLYGWGDWLQKGVDTVKRGVKKGREIVKSIGLDKAPLDHIVDWAKDEYKKQQTYSNKTTKRPEGNNDLGFWTKNALATAKAFGLNGYYKGEEKDTLYRKNIFNLIDPTSTVPQTIFDINDYRKLAEYAKSGKEYAYQRTHINPAADAAWAKRLGLPYDSTLLIDNTDGSVHLSPVLEAEIPTDTAFLKDRIVANEKLSKKTYGAKGQSIDAALRIDKEALEALRKTYQTGEPVVMDEHSHVNRDWRNKKPEYIGITPLSLMHRYTLQYDKNNNTMNYSDVYDFDEFEDFVPGEPFTIRGSIDLNKRKK